MARIKIKDLPRDRKIGKEELEKIMGGGGINPQPEPPAIYATYSPKTRIIPNLDANLIVVSYGG